jgi:hypothetical protein
VDLSLKVSEFPFKLLFLLCQLTFELFLEMLPLSFQLTFELFLELLLLSVQLTLDFLVLLPFA